MTPTKVASLFLMALLLGSVIVATINIQQAHATPTIQFTNAIQLTNNQPKPPRLRSNNSSHFNWVA